MFQPRLRTTSALLCVLLTACGGGSSNAPSSTNSSGGGNQQQGNPPSSTPITPAASTGSINQGTETPAASGSTSPAFVFDETARFNIPTNITSDAAGNLFVIDSSNKTIRKISANGNVSTLSVTLTSAAGLAIDNASNLYTNDAGTIRKIAPDGSATTLAAVPSTAKWMTIDPDGNLYVLSSDSSGAGAILKVAQNGTVTTLFSGAPLDRDPSLPPPGGIARDAAGNLYVGVRSSVWKFPLSGTPTEHASGLILGQGGAEFVSDMAIDEQGNLYVAKYSPASGISSACYVYDICWGPVDYATGYFRILPDGSVDALITDTPGPAVPLRTLNGTTFSAVSSGPIAWERYGALHLAIDPKGEVVISYSRDYTIYKRLGSGEWMHIAGKSIEAGSSD